MAKKISYKAMVSSRNLNDFIGKKEEENKDEEKKHENRKLGNKDNKKSR